MMWGLDSGNTDVDGVVAMFHPASACFRFARPVFCISELAARVLEFSFRSGTSTMSRFFFFHF